MKRAKPVSGGSSELSADSNRVLDVYRDASFPNAEGGSDGLPQLMNVVTNFLKTSAVKAKYLGTDEGFGLWSGLSYTL